MNYAYLKEHVPTDVWDPYTASLASRRAERSLRLSSLKSPSLKPRPASKMALTTTSSTSSTSSFFGSTKSGRSFAATNSRCLNQHVPARWAQHKFKEAKKECVNTEISKLKYGKKSRTRAKMTQKTHWDAFVSTGADPEVTELLYGQLLSEGVDAFWIPKDSRDVVQGDNDASPYAMQFKTSKLKKSRASVVFLSWAALERIARSDDELSLAPPDALLAEIEVCS